MCNVCKDYTVKVLKIGTDDGWFSLYEHYMEVINEKNGTIMAFKIQFCPMCGRKLVDKL